MATTSKVENWVSHDGAEERTSYSEQDDISYPSELVIDELDQDTLNKTQVGRTRSRYKIEGISEIEDLSEPIRYEITVTEAGTPGYESIIRATPADSEETVYHGRSNSRPETLLMDVGSPLDGAELEKNWD